MTEEAKIALRQGSGQSAESVKPRWSWKKRTIICIGVFLLYGFMYTYNHSPIYKIEPIEATIVDSVTGEPVEGAIVVSLWRSYDFSKGRAYRVLRVDEAVTDKDGKFSFEGSWPSILMPRSALTWESHDLYVYKHGYEHEILETVDKDTFEEKFGSIDKKSHESLDRMVTFYPIEDRSLEQRGFFRYSIWSGRKIEIVKHDFSKFNDKDYQAVRQGLITLEGLVRPLERAPGGYKLYNLVNYAKEYKKTKDFLGHESFDYNIGLILKKEHENDKLEK